MIKPLVISCGDPSGIGPEIILKAWQKRQSLPPFVVLGDACLLKARAQHFHLNIPIESVDETYLQAPNSDKLAVLPLKNKLSDRPGIPVYENAAGIIEAIERGVGLVNRQLASALVTCPIAKKPLYEAGYPYPGHTEFLGALAEQITGKKISPVMMLAGPHLRTVPVTVHIALQAVPSILSTERIIETGKIAHHDLQTRFGLSSPILAVAGLNPHAGEGGTMGQEDENIIRPAIEELRAQGINVIGPLPSDTMFHEAARKRYDVALCMYHDQALIPVKTIGFDETVNVTLGLPFIRTSPDHGTAFDIAQKGIANPTSLMSAIRMAGEMAAR